MTKLKELGRIWCKGPALAKRLRRAGWMLATAALLAFLLPLVSTRTVSARNGFPPPPPCIATSSMNGGFTAGDVTEVQCIVRNVGIAPHNVTVVIPDAANNTHATPFTATVAPGQTVGPGINFGFGACVVTTAEGTKQALGDLAVIGETFLLTDENAGSIAGPITEGRIFDSCAPANPPTT